MKKTKAKAKLELITPGEILSEEFMKPHGLSQNRLARDLDISPARVHDIVHGKSAITANIALRLGKYFRTSASFWMNLQAEYDLRKAHAAIGAEVAARVRTLTAAE
jgi:addiction module HigA family antidote